MAKHILVRAANGYNARNQIDAIEALYGESGKIASYRHYFMQDDFSTPEVKYAATVNVGVYRNSSLWQGDAVDIELPTHLPAFASDRMIPVSPINVDYLDTSLPDKVDMSSKLNLLAFDPAYVIPFSIIHNGMEFPGSEPLGNMYVPCVVKPVNGSGSKGIIYVDNGDLFLDNLPDSTRYLLPTCIVQKAVDRHDVDGELVVDCVAAGEFVKYSYRKSLTRVKGRDSIVQFPRLAAYEIERIEKIVLHVANVLGRAGAFNIQLRLDPYWGWSIMEVDTRLSGSSCALETGRYLLGVYLHYVRLNMTRKCSFTSVSVADGQLSDDSKRSLL